MMALGGASPRPEISWRVVAWLAVGAAAASLLNGASNTINQIFDLEIDRINRPARPLPSGRVSIAEAWGVAVVLVAVSLSASWFVGPREARHAFFWLGLAATVITFLYSAPPVRFKRHWGSANVAIALPRGLLLPVAGWAAVASPAIPDPWCIGVVLFFFLLGAASTKDFADIRGDSACGCRTLPVKFGVQKAAEIMAFFLILPFLLFPLWSWLGWVGGRAAVFDLLGVGLAAWGAHVARIILRRPEDLAVENHPSWFHMYLMMMVALAGSALAYWI
jgi:4-hydroxybenzoate polyprenyltransferase